MAHRPSPDETEVERLTRIGQAFLDKGDPAQADQWFKLAAATERGLDKTYDYFRLNELPARKR